MLVRLPTVVLVTLGLGLVAACGSKTFDSVQSGGAAGSGGTDRGTGGDGCPISDPACNPRGGDAGSSSGSGGSAGKGVGGTGHGGTANGGDGAGPGDVGGASATGGSNGGTGARAGEGSGGSTSGIGGGGAGAGAGAGGSAAGAGGSVAGAGGCGPCIRVACLPPVTISVTAPGNVAGLTGELESSTTGTTLGPLQCYPDGGATCSWHCQYYQTQLPDGDYTIVLTAPGYATKNVDFTVTNPTNCGCCGCGCGVGYQGSAALEPDGSATPECCSTLNEMSNCGSCGNACDSGQTCTSGVCEKACLAQGAGCDATPTGCCSGLFCCSGAGGAPRFCYAQCPQ